MPRLHASDGIDLYYEETGAGAPMVFLHELAGDFRSFEPQIRYFSRAFRCIAYNARGYPPSDVPSDPDSYSQDRAVEDIKDVMDGFGLSKAHLVGVSMGGSAVLHFGLRYPDRATSLVVAGAGSGAVPGRVEQFRKESETMAQIAEQQGMEAAGRLIAAGSTRIQH
ncbi:MAG: alpha/beta fold hydrolase, partial [Acetobacteraceae bacterium]|nr:alpha/beta fold hydrolase [Acetobacteraceae bacterium]